MMRAAMLAVPLRSETLSSSARLSMGRGRLAVARIDGRSSAVLATATSPLKLFVTRPCAEAVWGYTTTIGGGLLAGDEVELDLAIGRDATCFLGTQASTKVHGPHARALAAQASRSRQAVAARIEHGALLAMISDPLTCFAGARHVQRLSFALEAGASLFAIDGFTAGRSANGERWAFESLEMRTEVTVAGRALVVDGLRLEAEAGAMGTIGARMGRFDAFSTALLVGPRVAALAGRVLETVAALPIFAGAARLVSASPLRLGGATVGAIVRAAATRPAAVAELFSSLFQEIAEPLGESPWQRRG
jgi:urease accessory protein